LLRGDPFVSLTRLVLDFSGLPGFESSESAVVREVTVVALRSPHFGRDFEIAGVCRLSPSREVPHRTTSLSQRLFNNPATLAAPSSVTPRFPLRGTGKT